MLNIFIPLQKTYQSGHGNNYYFCIQRELLVKKNHTQIHTKLLESSSTRKGIFYYYLPLKKLHSLL